MVVDLKRYETLTHNFNKIWSYLQSLSESEEVVYSNISELRVYDNQESMIKALKEVGFVYISEDTPIDIELIKSLPRYEDLGLITNRTGRFLLEGRYIFPVRDMLGNILTLIGWYPDEKKYITAPSYYFMRSALFFGMEQVQTKGKNTDGFYFICEGIFDSIALRSLGYRAYATMGVELSKAKKLLYPVLGGGKAIVVGISDRDRVGNAVREYDKWSCNKYLTWTGGVFEVEGVDGGYKIKDIDDLIKLFEPNDLKAEFNRLILTTQDKIVKLEL